MGCPARRRAFRAPPGLQRPGYRRRRRVGGKGREDGDDAAGRTGTGRTIAADRLLPAGAIGMLGPGTCREPADAAVADPSAARRLRGPMLRGGSAFAAAPGRDAENARREIGSAQNSCPPRSFNWLAPTSARPGTKARAGRRCARGAFAWTTTPAQAPGSATAARRWDAGARGGRGPPTPRTPECAISSSTPQGRARNRGMRPTEAAEVDPGHPGKRHAPVWNAADYNAAMLDAIKPAAETPPPRVFQAPSQWRQAAARARSIKGRAQGHEF